MSAARITNWAGNLTYSAREWVAPTSLEGVQDAVVRAAGLGRRLRVVGTRHCFNDIADTDGVALTLRDLPRRIVVDDAAQSVIVDGGATYTDVNRVLAQHGRALANLASLPHISIAGAIATATHGSGDANPCLAAAVRSLTHVTARGELRTVSRGDGGFAHHPVHLGLFGPIVSVELDTVPAFDIATTVYEGLAFEAVAEHFDEVTHGLYSFSIAPNWGEGGRALLFAKRVRGSDSPDAVCGARRAGTPRHPSPGADPRAVTEQFGVLGPSDERLTHFRSDFEPSVGDEVQSEYFVSRETAPQVLAVLPRFADVLARLAHSMEIRSVAADDLTLSPFRERASVAIHITWRRDVAAVMRELPALEAALDAVAEVRPHWGKLSATSPMRLRALFPGLLDVDAEAHRHDPAGMFRNTWTDRLFGGA